MRHETHCKLASYIYQKSVPHLPTVLPDVSGRTWIEERQDTVNFQDKT